MPSALPVASVDPALALYAAVAVGTHRALKPARLPGGVS